MEEHVFLRNEEVLVTSTRVCIDKKTIAMNAVCSVDITKEKVEPPKFLLIFSALAYLVALLNPNPSMIESGLVFGTLALVLFFSFWYFRVTNRKEAVIIELMSGQNEIIDKTEIENLESIYNAINEAIIFRG